MMIDLEIYEGLKAIQNISFVKRAHTKILQGSFQ